ncbi:MAG: hypothetical protein AB7F76_11540 [Parvibaculaceae bacterium]
MDTKAKAALSIAAILVFFLATWMYALTHTRLIIANGSNQPLDEVTVSYNRQIVWVGSMLPSDIQIASFTAKTFNEFHVKVMTAGKTRCTHLGYHFPYNGDLVAITVSPAGDALYSAQRASTFTHMVGQIVSAVLGLFGEGSSFVVPEPNDPASGCEESPAR